MDRNLLSEIVRFIKDHARKIVLMAVVVGIVYTAFNFVTAYLNQLPDATAQETEQQKETIAPAAFRFHVEVEDGQSYTNAYIFEEFFLREEKLKEAERETGVNISELLELEEQAGFEKTNQNRGILGTIRSPDSAVYTFRTNLGSEDANLAVAEFYFEYLISEEIPVLEGKQLYILDEPQLVPPTEEEEIEQKSNVQLSTLSLIIRKILLDGVIGLVLGFGLSAFFYLFKAILSKKITYSFAYNWEVSDYHAIADQENLDEVINHISFPHNEDKVILSDTVDLANLVTEKLGFENKNQVLSADNIGDIPLINSFKEVIFVLKSNESSKRWFNEQRALLNMYPISVKIIQVNE